MATFWPWLSGSSDSTLSSLHLLVVGVVRGGGRVREVHALRASLTYMKQSWPDSGRGFRVQVLKALQILLHLLLYYFRA